MPWVSLQDFADNVFEGAYNITTDAQQGLGIFDNLSEVLSVDVNVSGMNRDIQVSSRIAHCYTAPCLVSQHHNRGLCCSTVCVPQTGVAQPANPPTDTR